MDPDGCLDSDITKGRGEHTLLPSTTTINTLRKPLASIWGKRVLSFCRTARYSGRTRAAVDRITAKIMTIKSDQQRESIMEEDKFGMSLTLKQPFRPGGLMTSDLEKRLACGSKQNSSKEAHSDVAIRSSRSSDEQHTANLRPSEEDS